MEHTTSVFQASTRRVINIISKAVFKQLKIGLQRHFRALLQHKAPLNQPASLLILQFQGICVSLSTWFFIASWGLSRCLWKGLGER